MSRKSNKELVDSYREAYHYSTLKEKGEALDMLVSVSGYDRKSLIKLLNQEPSQRVALRHRTARYNEEFCAALTLVWQQLGYICAKRFVPFLPTFVPLLESTGFTTFSPEVREKLLTVSAATADRLLKPERTRVGRGTSMTKSGNILRTQILVRTGYWDQGTEPGFFEMDTVAHNGGNVGGNFCHTLTLTDIASGWTECVPTLGKDNLEITRALKALRKRLPIDLKGLDSDNGSEFINNTMAKYCFDEKICFTRSRPYKKNDQAHVEEKNGSVVRRFAGYLRYDSKTSLRVLNELFEACHLFVNFFQPSMKLDVKSRVGAKVRKRYLIAQTPCQRLLASSIGSAQKEHLQSTFQKLNPVVILEKIKSCQNDLFKTVTTPAFEPNHFRDPKPQKLSYSKSENKAAPRKKTRQRGRKKLLESILDEVHGWLLREPTLCGLSTFKKINATYPGTLKPGQKMTVERLVRAWRDLHPEFMHLYTDQYRRGMQRRGKEVV